MYNFNYTKEEIEDALMDMRKTDKEILMDNKILKEFSDNIEKISSVNALSSFPFCTDVHVGFLIGFCCAQKLMAKEKVLQ